LKIHWLFYSLFLNECYVCLFPSNSLVFDQPNLLIRKKFLPKFVKILQKKFVFSGDKLTISFHKF